MKKNSKRYKEILKNAIKDKKINHVLNFYKVENGKFIKIF